MRKGKNKKKRDGVETSEKKKKTVFLRQYHTSSGFMAWTTITWNNKNEDQLQFSAYDKEAADGSGDGDGLTIMIPYPNNLHLHRGVATAAWKSKLFFISGCDTSRSRWRQTVCVPTVCAFDTVRRAWEDRKYKPIQTPRMGHAAVVVGDRIYVFGGGDKVLPEHWGERFDILNNKWIYLPPPPACFHVFTHAVYYQSLPDNTVRPLILLPLPAIRDDPPICVFDCITEKWLPDIQPRLPPSHPEIYPERPLTLQDRLSVIQGVLFWHGYGSIWGYDLIKGEALGSFFTLPPTDQLPRDNWDVDYSQVYLIHPGHQKLFLVWTYTDLDPNLVYCYKFGVQTKQPDEHDTTRIRLVCEDRSVLHSKSIGRCELVDALVL